MANINRRRFLQSSSAMGFAAGTGLLAAIGSSRAFAADTSGYKALVCVFFKGGMDSLDLILPKDSASHDALSTIRPGLFGAYGVGSGASSRDRENILKINPLNSSDFGGREFGFAPEMSGLQGLFEAGNAAILGNVGPLIEPTTRTTMDNFSAQIPDRLFSHNDQQSTWMSFGTEGAQSGWGGRFVEAALKNDAASNPTFSAISTSGNDVFLSGNNVRQFSAPSNPESADILRQKWRLGSGYHSDAARAVLRDHLASSDIASQNLFGQDLIGVNGRAIQNVEAYKSAIEGGTAVATEFPENNLGGQLRTVANTIAVRNTLNVRRQIFFVSIGGFDTHDSQRNSMPRLQTEISTSVTAFQAAMVELGLSDNVTLFTGSDFGRTAIDNGDGTDHGWGAHHLIIGGAVQGKRIYGSLPDYDLGSQSYTESRGRLIPSVSVDQYAATLGGWFGLDQGELNEALPNLDNFTQKDLGFLTANNS
ncbi:DUF1501 domain-containing protein [Hellea balneolensis]|uniref:DUF1501 domain-containing protein n=1 Tax=Hellea balneolensis TaxID=287478 RepID=UPI0003F9FE68|nr:DUF1501 domain-containing protein [Hellea balneolensis]